MRVRCRLGAWYAARSCRYSRAVAPRSKPRALQATLLALGRTPGDVSAQALLPLLSYSDSAVRGAAAIALAKHQPEVAVKAVSIQLQREMDAEQVLHDEHMKQKDPSYYTQLEIAEFTKSFKCQMEMVRALFMLNGNAATNEIERLAFGPVGDYSIYDSILASFQLWDRIGQDPGPAIQALASGDKKVADRAEWMLVKADL